MNVAMDNLIRRYGNDMLLIQNGQEQSIRAFLHETHSRSRENILREFSPLGEIRRGTYVYIGPAEPLGEAGDLIVYGQRLFELRRAEPVTVGDHRIYCWGLCVEKGGDGKWGS